MGNPALADPATAAGLVERASGLLVPKALGTAPDVTTGQAGVAYDPDGRRRVVLSREDRKLLNRLAGILQERGLAVFMVCRSDMPRPDGRPPCGLPMEREAWDTPQRGYGCRCTRVHLA